MGAVEAPAAHLLTNKRPLGPVRRIKHVNTTSMNFSNSTGTEAPSLRHAVARVVNESLVYLDTKVDNALATVSTLRVGRWTGIGNSLLFMCVAFIVHCQVTGGQGSVNRRIPRHAFGISAY